MQIGNVSFNRLPSALEEHNDALVPIKGSETFIFGPRNDQQRKAYEELVIKRFFALQCPTGWGKTILLMLLIAGLSRRNNPFGFKRVIIIVPDGTIAIGFTTKAGKDFEVKPPDGDSLPWVCRDLTGEQNNKQERLLAKINPSSEMPLAPGELLPVIIATHSCFRGAMNILAETGGSISDTLTIVDECHHSNDGINTNQLGSHLNTIINGNNNGVWLTTATMGRNDGDRLVDCQEDFHHFAVTYAEYFSTFNYLKEFKLHVISYKDSAQTVAEFARDHKVLIYSHCDNGRLPGDISKKEFIDSIITGLKAANPQAEVWDGSGEIPDNAIIDITEDINIEAKKDEIHRDGDGVPSKIFAIVTVSRMQEGSNWLPLDRVLDFTPSHSCVVRAQRTGRLLRDYPNKTLVEYFSILPHSDRIAAEKREQFAVDHFGHLILAMVDMSKYHCPSTWPTSKEKRWKPTSTIDAQASTILTTWLIMSPAPGKRPPKDFLRKMANTLVNIIPDRQHREIMVFRHLRRLQVAMKKAGNDVPPLIQTERLEDPVIGQIIREFGAERVQEHLVKIRSNLCGYVSHYMSDTCGADTFVILKKRLKTYEEEKAKTGLVCPECGFSKSSPSNKCQECDQRYRGNHTTLTHKTSIGPKGTRRIRVNR